MHISHTVTSLYHTKSNWKFIKMSTGACIIFFDPGFVWWMPGNTRVKHSVPAPTVSITLYLSKNIQNDLVDKHKKTSEQTDYAATKCPQKIVLHLHDEPTEFDMLLSWTGCGVAVKKKSRWDQNTKSQSASPHSSLLIIGAVGRVGG